MKSILSGNVKEKKVFPDYELKIITDFKRFNELMYQKEKEVQLVRMAAGDAWDWISKNDKKVYDIEIQGGEETMESLYRGLGSFCRGDQ